MYQLVSGQIDVYRLDYLKRDSFFTGVTEGNINTDRIIAMMSVENENLVFEKKGLYSIEKFLLARRLMYWQVYLHKTSLVAELILIKIFKRFRSLVLEKNEIIKSSHILYHLIHANSDVYMTDSVLTQYLSLEDSDVLHLLKNWINHKDNVLSTLSKQIIYRDLPKIKIQNKPFDNQVILKKVKLLEDLDIKEDIQDYFIFSGSISNQTYISDHSQILLKSKSGKLKSLTETIDYFDISQFSKPIYRYYLCYPK